ncbi:hypothetical protein BH11ACT3_BH11ACT3_18220 [soil metagenome]
MASASAPAPLPTKLDYSAFSVPLTREQVAAWRQAAKASGKRWAQVNVASIIILVVVLPIVLGTIFVPVLGIISVAGDSSNGAQSAGVIIVPLLIISGLVVLVVALARGANGNRWERWMRLDSFGTANGMVFSPADPNPSYPGAIFQLGSSRTSYDHFVSASGRFFDMGNFKYTTSNGKNSTTHTWGFMAFNLDRRLPNMVLDAQANNGFFGSNLPASFDKKQVLHLEGDFDRYFTLYCPQQYERDALYVFTPDLMALLIDNAAPFDVEIVDDWMFVYASQPFSMTWPGVYDRLFRILNTVGAKTLTQTDRYVDERVGNFAANVVAPPGQRLKRRIPVVAIVIVAVLVLWPLLGIFGGIVSGITGN